MNEGAGASVQVLTDGRESSWRQPGSGSGGSGGGGGERLKGGRTTCEEGFIHVFKYDSRVRDRKVPPPTRASSVRYTHNSYSADIITSRQNKI